MKHYTQLQQVEILHNCKNATDLSNTREELIDFNSYSETTNLVYNTLMNFCLIFNLIE
jgi:hypothetical protein